MVEGEVFSSQHLRFAFIPCLSCLQEHSKYSLLLGL